MGRKIRKKRTGGLLIGPSHEEGGILATTPGMPDVELEGGEYIINAQTVNALGTEFLDQLNSTQTSYHTGGFGAGELPSPSNYRRGGVIKRKRMPHGGPHARANEFRNRRTGNVVRTGAAYHIHPDKGPMEGAVHNPDIPGGTAGHDFYDRVNGRNNMRSARNESRLRRTDKDTQGRRFGSARVPGGNVVMGSYVNAPSGNSQDHQIFNPDSPPAQSSMRRGGKMRKMQQGGHTHDLGIPYHMHVAPGVGATTGPTYNPIYSEQYTDPISGQLVNNPPFTTSTAGTHTHRKGITPVRRMRRGGRTRRRMQTGGRNGCGPGMVYQNGGCVPSMRAGGRIKKMPHGGPHNGNGRGGVFCPSGNYGFDEYGKQVCV
jgi:hypothetical protein